MTDELELYLHIPFCVRKCNYCDFLSGPAGEETRAAYVGALCNELKSRAEKCRGREISSIFVGGGTPTVLEAGQLSSLFENIKTNYKLISDTEITVECNPGTLTHEKLMALKEAGVNRLSLGLQSADNEELKLLGRIHTFEEFLENYRLARELGFKNINIDLMQSLPYQTREKAAYSLKKVLELKPEHLSVYSLIIEEGTPFYKEYGQKTELLPDEDTEREIYHETEESLKKAGFLHYEISNYALPGFESRHNSGYWTGKDYLGFGTGAASLFENRRFTNSRDLKTYISSQGQCRDKESLQELTLEDRMSEFMFLGLRMLQGVSEKEFEKRFGKKLMDVYGDIIKKHLDLGTLNIKGDYISLTNYGLDVSNIIMSEFV